MRPLPLMNASAGTCPSTICAAPLVRTCLHVSDPGAYGKPLHPTKAPAQLWLRQVSQLVPIGSPTQTFWQALMLHSTSSTTQATQPELRGNVASMHIVSAPALPMFANAHLTTAG